MEVNIIRKKIRQGLVRIAYIYPGTYEFMVSSLSSHIIYYLTNSLFDEVYLERFHVKNLYGEEPFPRSLETNSPLKDFELILTSIHYEPTISNLVRILYYSGVDPIREKREIPVIAGGPAVMGNPHPYNHIVDAYIIGEAEDTLPKIINAWIRFRGDKKSFLEEIARYEFVYVPGISTDKVYRRWVEDINTSFYPVKQFWDSEREPVFGRGFILETSRGCMYLCRFCIEGRLFKPFRRRTYSVLKRLVDEGLEATGVDRVLVYSLVYPSTIDDKKILEYIVEQGIKVSLPSMRIDYLDNDTLELIKNSGQKTLTIAPETFNPLIQKIIAKYINIDLIDAGIERIIDKGFDLKLYLIYGFKGLDPTIYDKNNIEYLKKLIKKAREKNVKISISLNPLVPKPHTPFQWIGMISLEKARNILRLYRRELRGYVETRPLEIGWAWIQASIALADENIGRILIEWSIEGGDLGSWRRVLTRRNYSTDYVFKGYNVEEKIPWNNIVIYENLDKTLYNEYYSIKQLTSK
ncbi:MAG: radical SAM protein [Desulfurococcales archaeon ex4484_58]|nr:MAG: radical SAM protein [Desulfurococcales archaeon ex4484_58]